MTSIRRARTTGLRRRTAALAVGLMATGGLAANAAAASARATPDAPVLGVASGSRGLALFWKEASAATGFQITQATDAAMTQDVVTYTTQGKGGEFTPYGLVDGQTYYFEVAAQHDAATSLPSNQVSATALSHAADLTVMTYNILRHRNDGRSEGDGRVAPWSKRKAKQVELIEGAHPDVIAIEEGSDYIGDPAKGRRQIDSLRKALGGSYALAHTEIPPGQPHFLRTGVYILYRKSRIYAAGNGDHWSLPDTRWAAYQTLKDIATGARFVFASVHLVEGNGANYDAKRQKETQSLLSQARAYTQSSHLPVIYAGDFNSTTDKHFTYDAPSQVMRNSFVADAFLVAQQHTNATYNSADEYLRHPLHSSDRIDHIFVSAGIGAPGAGIVIHLKNGHYVGPIPSDHNPVYADVTVPY